MCRLVRRVPAGGPGFTGPGVGPARGGVISRHPALPVLTQVYEPAFLVALLTTIRTASNLAQRRYGPWNGPRRSRAIQHSAATIRAVERPGNGGPTRQNLNPSGASNVADNMESIAGGAIPPFGLGCIAGPARIVCIGPGFSSESVLLRW